jgi:hypothetical protein
MSGGISSGGLIKLTLCGPTDVAKEMALAAEAINDWNCQHGERRGFGQNTSIGRGVGLP